MSAHQETAAEPQPQKGAGVPDLLDDVGNGDDRNEVVADHRHGKAAFVQAAGHVAVE